MRMKTLLCVLAAVSPMATFAQFDFGGGGDGTPPWKQGFALNPKTRVKLNFQNSGIDMIVSFFSKTSGITIVKDPNLKTPLTLQSPSPQSLDDAFAMLDAVLGLSNFQLQKQGNFLVVKAKGGGGFGGGNFDPSQFMNGSGGSSRGQSLQLKVYHLQYASATQLAKVINDVFAPTPQNQQNNNPFAGFGGAFGVNGAGGGGGQGGGGGGGFGGRGRRGGGGGNNNQANIPTVKASADDYSNSLIVNAANRQQDQVADIIAAIDKPSDSPQHSRVFKLNYVAASDMQSVIQGVLQASAPLGRGNTGQTQNQGGGNRGGFGGFGGGPGAFFRAAFGGQNNNNAGGTVVAEAQSNALIVTSTDDNLAAVDKIIKQLDTPAIYADTTFVYPLKNARADVVANLLNESFGNRTTNGPTGGSLTGSGPSQSSTSSTSLVSSTPGGNTGGGGGNNRNNNNGGFGGQQTASGSTSSLSGLTSSLDAAGHVVNVRSLSGQVLLVPNIDTNSIIVVAPPNLQPVVMSVLNQMDELPAQVMIEAVIMEADLNKQDQFGVEWNIAQTKLFGSSGTAATIGQDFGLHLPPNGSGATSTNGISGAPGAALEKGFTYALTAGQATAFINAVANNTKSNVLSTPRILTSNNATAQINISESVPYISSQTTDTNGTVISNTSFLNVGVILTVTPRITSNGYVMMDVSQTANTLLSFINGAPEVNQRESQSTVSIKDGETIVLGGIIQNNISDIVNKVPILGDLPIIGNLFRSSNKTKGKTELLVFLTPHVVRTPQDARALREMTTQQMDKGMRDQVTETIHDQPATPSAPSTVPAPSTKPAADMSPSDNGGAPVSVPMNVTTTVLTPGQVPSTMPSTTPGPTITTPQGQAPPGAAQPAPAAPQVPAQTAPGAVGGAPVVIPPVNQAPPAQPAPVQPQQNAPAAQ